MTIQKPMHFIYIKFWQNSLPSDRFGPVRIHVADESSIPCIKITGCFPGLAIRCVSKMYPSSVTILCTSDGYPYALISSGCSVKINEEN